MISFLAKTGLRECVKNKCRDSHKTVLFFLRALLCLARVSFKLDSLSQYIYNSCISQDCTKLAGNGSDFCNQQFDLISLDNRAIYRGENKTRLK